jgi:hypothetical protein
MQAQNKQKKPQDGLFSSFLSPKTKEKETVPWLCRKKNK